MSSKYKLKPHAGRRNWPWPSHSSERGTKHVFRVNLSQIRSAVPEISHTNKNVTDRTSANKLFQLLDSTKQKYVGEFKTFDLELVDGVISMKQFVADVAEGVSIADVIQREHVKRPIVDVLRENATQSRFIYCLYGVLIGRRPNKNNKMLTFTAGDAK